MPAFARKLTAVVSAVAGLIALSALPPASAANTTPVQVVFSGSGTYTIDQTYVGDGGQCTSHDVATFTWSAIFRTTIDNGKLQSGAGQLASGIGPGNLAFTIDGTCAYKSIVPPCNAPLTFGAAPQPVLTADGSDPQRVEAQSLSSDLTAGACNPTDVAFIGSDLSVLDASLPDSMTGVADVPSSALGSDFTANVSSGSAPGQVTSSCLGVGQHGTGNTACSASLTWSGTIEIKPEGCGGPKIKKVISHDLSTGKTRELPANEWSSEGISGPDVQPGETIGNTGANRQLTIAFDDGTPGMFGSMWMIGPHQYIHVPVNCTEVFAKTGRYLITVYSQDPLNLARQPQSTYFFFEPNVYRSDGSWDVSNAESMPYVPCDCSRDITRQASRAPARGTAAAAARGAIAFTLSLVGHKRTLVHVIEGHVRVSSSPGHTRVLSGGSGAEVSRRRISGTTSWPASAQALVPSTQRPPALMRLHHSPVRSGRLTVSFRLDRPAQVAVLVLLGGHRLAIRTVRGHRGTNAIVLKRRRWPHGKYSLTVTATRSQLASTQSLNFRA